MQLFVVVLTEGEYVHSILQNLKDKNYHGSVLSTKSIRHALMDSEEPLPYFGGISKVMEPNEEVTRPMIFVVVEKDEEIEDLRHIVNETVNGIKGKGLMYSIPINHVEGLN